MILRNFLYLDTDMLDDYLSTMEGYLIESEELIENKTTKNLGKAKVSVLEVGKEADVEKGSIKKVTQTSAGKFQKLYGLLDSQSMVQYLEVFDSTIWNSLKRNEILEVPGIIQVSKMYNTVNSIGNISPLMDLMQAFGKSDLMDSKTTEAMKGIKAVSELDIDKEIPVIIDLEGNKNYNFTASLSPEYIKGDISKLEGNVTIVGKIQKIIAKGERHEVFSMVKGIDTLVKSQNREQRRKYQDSKNDNVSDFIQGPAIVITPLAIFR